MDREDTPLWQLFWASPCVVPLSAARPGERTQLWKWELFWSCLFFDPVSHVGTERENTQFWACLHFYPLSPIRTFGDRKHLVWVEVILTLSSLCPTGFPTKLCPLFPVPMHIFHAHHNLPRSWMKYLPPKHPWI